MNMNQFTQKSLAAIQSAQDIAQEHGNQQIEQAHFLYALLEQENGLIPQLLGNMGITFPSYVGGMVMGAVLRNVSSYSGKFETPLAEIDCIGNISLSFFVSMALMSLKLWQLADLALPMIATLLTQVVFISLFMICIGYRSLGADYDAAVMVTGCCGFGLGAMPNGVSNMQAFTKKWGPSSTAFLVVPGVGSVIIDVVNALILTAFMNFL